MVFENATPAVRHARFNRVLFPQFAIFNPLVCEYTERCSCSEVVREARIYGGEFGMHPILSTAASRKLLETAKEFLHAQAFVSAIFVMPLRPSVFQFYRRETCTVRLP